MSGFGPWLKRYLAGTDKVLILACLTTAGYGLTILSGLAFNLYDNPRMFLVQSGAFVAGLIGALFISTFDYHTMADLWPFHAGLCWLLVLGTFVLGYQRPGTDDRAWYLFPGNIMFQPAEIAKISFIITFAYHLSRMDAEEINNFKNLVLLILHGAAPVLIVHLQGDDGTALVFASVFAAMIFAAGLRLRYIAAGFATLTVLAPLWFFFLLTPGKQQRILNIFFPENDLSGSGWQQYQGRISIGSGGIFGKVLFNPNLREFSEIKNDFIFAFIGEALGLIGCLAVLFLIAFICYRILVVGRIAQDRLGALICVGFFMLITFQTLLNVGMCLSVMPVIGVTLPFFSTGGSSLLTTMLGMGVILSVYRHNRETLFYSK